MPGGHRLSQHHRPARAHGHALATQSPDRRRHRHRRQHARRLVVRQRRRGDRHQPGQRQRGAGGANRDHARRGDPPLRDTDAILRADPCHQHLAGHRAGRAGGFGVSVHRRHRGDQQQLRPQPGFAGRGAQCGAFLGSRHRRRQRNVFRDRTGQRALSQRAPRPGPADLRGPRLCRGAPFQTPAGQHRGGFYRAGVSV